GRAGAGGAARHRPAAGGAARGRLPRLRPAPGAGGGPAPPRRGGTGRTGPPGRLPAAVHADRRGPAPRPGGDPGGTRPCRTAGPPAVLQEWLTGLSSTDWPALAAVPGVWFRLLCQAALGLHTSHQAGLVHGHLRPGLFLLTGEGTLKLCGLGEPPWLVVP